MREERNRDHREGRAASTCDGCSWGRCVWRTADPRRLAAGAGRRLTPPDPTRLGAGGAGRTMPLDHLIPRPPTKEGARAAVSDSPPANVRLFDNSDPEMQRAYERARASFRYFWREVAWERR